MLPHKRKSEGATQPQQQCADDTEVTSASEHADTNPGVLGGRLDLRRHQGLGVLDQLLAVSLKVVNRIANRELVCHGMPPRDECNDLSLTGLGSICCVRVELSSQELALVVAGTGCNRNLVGMLGLAHGVTFAAMVQHGTTKDGRQEGCHQHGCLGLVREFVVLWEG